ncbi:hypothetical protein EVAR_11110_1 [Eumeta japonica]|uniref:Uncharacterized protein n=1 Tax=Eumeta variegata TaxID=151549 RepID=A0A4C1U460_EUMVA|nr:hypothetical protein EVAR_11110_1 [Eumeta japonica]
MTEDRSSDAAVVQTTASLHCSDCTQCMLDAHLVPSSSMISILGSTGVLCARAEARPQGHNMFFYIQSTSSATYLGLVHSDFGSGLNPSPALNSDFGAASYFDPTRALDSNITLTPNFYLGPVLNFDHPDLDHVAIFNSATEHVSDLKEAGANINIIRLCLHVLDTGLAVERRRRRRAVGGGRGG